jgi:epoxyqueuosine reductase QueG
MTTLNNSSKEQKNTLNSEIEKFLLDKGAIKVGFATQETMHSPEGIPSTDFTKILPDGQSAVCFAFPLDKEKIRAYLRKELPNGRVDHNKDNFDLYVKIIKISEELVDLLNEKGYNAAQIIPNFDYVGEGPAKAIGSKPQLSLRYLAVRSGLGHFGWSGNVLMKGYGATVLFGGIVTNANLEPTEPLPESESECNQCKLCTKVCAFRMFSDIEPQDIILGGYSFQYSKRTNICRCLTVCGGFSGLDKTGKWSTWAPVRHPYPETDDDVYLTMASAVKADSSLYVKGEREGFDRLQFKRDPILKKVFSGDKKDAGTVFKGVYLTCGNCQIICWGDPEKTAENYRILTNSGCTVLDDEGFVDVKRCEEAQKIYDDKFPNGPIITEQHKKFAKFIKNYLESE